MSEEITAKIKNCFEEEAAEKEIIVKREDGSELCRFTVKQLTIYQIQKCQSDEPEKLNANLIKAGVRNFVTPKGAVAIDDETIAKLSRSRLNGSGFLPGLFELMAAQVLGLNNLGEGEAKNSA